MKEYFVLDVTQYALFIDARYYFVPLTGHAESPGEIEFLFGPIAFYKGKLGYTKSWCKSLVLFQ